MTKMIKFVCHCYWGDVC